MRADGNFGAPAPRNPQPSDFDVDAPPQPSASGAEDDADLGPREDDVLPDSLAGALKQAAAATADAIRRSNNRCQVELLLTDFWDPISGPIFPNRGDQEKFWKMTRRFTEDLGEAMGTGSAGINAVYPDSGVAAMLSYQWKQDSENGKLPFKITSLTDRLPISKDDQIVVVACPDPVGANDCIRIVRSVGEQDEAEGREFRPIILFNPRLSSGDVGLGLNARRMRDSFQNAFVVTYSLRPIQDVGSVYRAYPGQWKVFLEDEAKPGRYKLIAERPMRPAGDALDSIIDQAENPAGVDGEPVQRTPIAMLGSMVKDMQRFMRSLSN